jgi:hypothetical protein
LASRTVRIGHIVYQSRRSRGEHIRPENLWGHGISGTCRS